MRADCFYYPETNRRPWAEQVAAGALCVSVEVAADATLVDILAAARQAGLGAGTQRSGCFEVQLDAGSWQHHKAEFRDRGYGKLDPSKAVFIPHTEIDQP